MHFSCRCARVYLSRCMKQKQESFMLQSKAEHLFLENVYGIFLNKRPGCKVQYLGRVLPVPRTLKRRRRSGSGSTCVKGSKIKRSGTRRGTGIAEVWRREVRWPAPRKQAALRQRATLLYATGTIHEPLVSIHRPSSEEIQENRLSFCEICSVLQYFWWEHVPITLLTVMVKVLDFITLNWPNITPVKVEAAVKFLVKRKYWCVVKDTWRCIIRSLNWKMSPTFF